MTGHPLARASDRGGWGNGVDGRAWGTRTATSGGTSRAGTDADGEDGAVKEAVDRQWRVGSGGTL